MRATSKAINHPGGELHNLTPAAGATTQRAHVAHLPEVQVRRDAGVREREHGDDLAQRGRGHFRRQGVGLGARRGVARGRHDGRGSSVYAGWTRGGANIGPSDPAPKIAPRPAPCHHETGATCGIVPDTRALAGMGTPPQRRGAVPESRAGAGTRAAAADAVRASRRGCSCLTCLRTRSPAGRKPRGDFVCRALRAFRY
jgi:hypothetical protein